MYTIKGKVRLGKNRGKALGYPTANIALHQEIPQGIYISQALFGNAVYSSISFVGNAKTFGERKVQLETHILSFDKNIYNKWITVRLIKKIRANQKFASEQELTQQMKMDVNKAKKYFKNV